jgi:hypothetical protein
LVGLLYTSCLPEAVFFDDWRSLTMEWKKEVHSEVRWEMSLDNDQWKGNRDWKIILIRSPEKNSDGYCPYPWFV